MQKFSRPISVLLRTPAVPLRYDGGLQNPFLFCLCSATTDFHRVKFGWDPPRVKWPQHVLKIRDLKGPVIENTSAMRHTAPTSTPLFSAA